MKYSATRFFVEYVLIVFCFYLLANIVVAIIGDYDVRICLTSDNNIIAVIFVYWWIPIPRMIDLYEVNQHATTNK